MKILIDTNIIINLEANKIIEESFTNFIQLAYQFNCDVFYHKDCEKDILRDKDIERQKITLSKLKKYTSFPNAAAPTVEFIKIVGEKKINDQIDNKQLYQAYLKYTDLFVTEDNGIHKKAKKVGCTNVINILEALEFLKELFVFRIPKHPVLEHLSLRNILPELKSEFFNSLRANYQGFDDWFIKSAQKNRQCYQFKSDSKIGAILIYKEENATEHRIKNLHENVLKMCTFKVAETAFGNKLGELFLSKMFALCIEKKLKFLYLTVFEGQHQLIELLEGFGFNKEKFTNSEGKEELRLIKCLDKANLELGTEINSKTNHPFYDDGPEIEKYVIPIQDRFYRTLFKDGNYRQDQLFDNTVNEIQGNTITKAYICASSRKRMQKGAILLFYASGTHQLIEPLGILESIQRVSDFKELKLFVNKRTVFTDLDLERMLDERKELTVVLFRHVYYLRNPVSFKWINQLKSFANKFTTITSLKEEDYQFLKKKKYFNERYIIN